MNDEEIEEALNKNDMDIESDEEDSDEFFTESDDSEEE